jgi:hypothetical protein
VIYYVEVILSGGYAGIAQLVERLICNEDATGSIPVIGSVNTAILGTKRFRRIVTEDQLHVGRLSRFALKTRDKNK